MAEIAEELKRIPMSAELGATLSRATEYAQAQQHAAVELEHLLLALTEDEDAAQVMQASRVNVALLAADVSRYLGDLDTRRDDRSDSSDIAIAADLKRILKAAAAAANQGRRRDINGAIVLAAIVGDGKSSAAHMLRAQGLTFDEAIKALQKALAAPQARPEPIVERPVYETDAILANARARVQTRAAPGLPPAPVRPEPTPLPPAAPSAAMPPATREPDGSAAAEKPSSPPQRDAVDVIPWPPPVRAPALDIDLIKPFAPLPSPMANGTSKPLPKARDAFISHEAETAQSQDVYPPAYQPAPMYAPDAQAAEPIEVAVSPNPPAPAPSQPPPLPLKSFETPPAHATAPSRPPSPSTRWPAAVAPAWRETGPPAPPIVPYDQPPPPTREQPTHDQFISASTGFYPSQPHEALYRPAPGPPPVPVHPASLDPSQAPPAPLTPPPMGTPPWSRVASPVTAEQRPLDRNQASPRAPVASDSNETTGPPARSKRGRKNVEKTTAGQMAEAVPRKMRVGKQSQIEVGLSSAEIDHLCRSLTGADGRVAPLAALSVRLRADDQPFIVQVGSPETQWLTQTNGSPDPLTWTWTMTPLKAGKRRLQLRVSAHTASASSQTETHALPDHAVTVAVARNYASVFGRLIMTAALVASGIVIAKLGEPVLQPLWSQLTQLMR